jgi:hypothetical protein
MMIAAPFNGAKGGKMKLRGVGGSKERNISMDPEITAKKSALNEAFSYKFLPSSVVFFFSSVNGSMIERCEQMNGNVRPLPKLALIEIFSPYKCTKGIESTFNC